MNDGQLKALQASIEHWRENVGRHAKGAAMLTGSEHCACCEYSNALKAAACDGCPISEHTGRAYCGGTPYYGVVWGRVPPTEMVDWLTELETGGSPPCLLDELYTD
jgi:hypothetical protein